MIVYLFTSYIISFLIEHIKEERSIPLAEVVSSSDSEDSDNNTSEDTISEVESER